MLLLLLMLLVVVMVLALHKERHEAKQLIARVRILRRVGRDVLEGPLQVLVHRQLARESGRLLAAHSKQAVVSGQHHAVESYHLRVFMICKDVVERNVFGDGWIVEDELDILWTVRAERVPELK